MTIEIATVEPAELIVGDTWTWKRSLSDFPANSSPAWVLTYYFRSQTDEFTVACTADGPDQLASVSKTTSAGYAAGLYSWIATVTDGTSRYSLGRGIAMVKPNPAATGAGLDPRSHARRVLEAIEAVIEGRATKDQEEYTIGTRSLKRTPIADLMQLRAQYQTAVSTEDAKAALDAGKVAPRLFARI